MFNYLVLAGKKGTTEHAAVWVPDSEASTCMHCFKSKFTALNRRVSVAWLICTYWLNERAGQEKIWLQVICSPPHVVRCLHYLQELNIFMAGPDFFQSISISSHFHFFVFMLDHKVFLPDTIFCLKLPWPALAIFLTFFFFITWHSTTVGSVVELFVVTVPPRSSSSLPSLQNHCECVTTAIMFYQVARPSQIKNQRKKVSWMWFVSIVFLCSGDWKGKQWMLNCRGNFYQPINGKNFIWWSCIISPDQAMFQPKKKVWIIGIQLCMMYIIW